MGPPASALFTGVFEDDNRTRVAQVVRRMVRLIHHVTEVIGGNENFTRIRADHHHAVAVGGVDVFRHVALHVFLIGVQQNALKRAVFHRADDDGVTPAFDHAISGVVRYA